MVASRWRSGGGWLLIGLAALLAWGGAARTPQGVLWGWPGWVALGVVGLSVALAVRHDTPGGGLGWGLSPLLLGLLVAPAIPGLVAFAGLPLLALVLAALLLAWGQTPRRPPHAAFFPLVLGVYLLNAARVQQEVGAEGDEPHYLMVAESLWRDRDVSLADDYAAGRYRAFYRTRPDLAPHYLVRGQHGEIYSQHAVGLSLLVLPAYVLGGYPGASFFMALLAALLACELRGLLRQQVADPDVAECLAWTVALSPPLVYFAGLIFTEIPAALALAWSLRRLREPGTLGIGGALAVGAALAGLPWLNVRYLPFPLLLLVYAGLGRAGPKVLAWLCLPLAVSAAALGLYHFQLYGFFDPRLVYGRRPGFAWRRLPEGTVALLFDQEFGLFAYAPLFAAAVPGVVALARSRRQREAFVVLALVGTVFTTAATWRMWWGGWTPPARFLLPVVPALVLALAAWLSRGFSAPTALLAAWGLFLGAAGVAHPARVHRDRDGSAPLLRAVSGAHEWTRLWPAFVLPGADPAKYPLAGLWGLGLAVAVARRRPGRPMSAAALGAAVLGAVATAAAAGRLGVGRSEGRDFTRLLGRPALDPQTGTWYPKAPAVWTPADLSWGPVYEAHRFPEGARLAARLPLSAGRYQLELRAERPSTASTPKLLLRTGGPGSGPAPPPTAFEPTTEGYRASFELVRSGVFDLSLTGGSVLVLKALKMSRMPDLQPVAPEPGPSR